MSVNEWGRELKASELVVKTVVILTRRPPVGVTAWVMFVDDELAVFRMGVVRTTLLLRVKDGGLVDDTDKPVRVFAYLGEDGANPTS